MPVYVKDSGVWREIPDLYVRDSTSFTNKTILNGYVKDGGSWREFFTLYTTSAYSSSVGSVAVPAQANALHVQYAVGGGSGGYRGADYDKAGGESAGPGGGSGAYVSDKVWTVTGGETLTITAGSSGAAGTGVYSGTSGAGSATSISGSSSGSLFSLAGGGACSVSGGGVKGPLRTNTASTGGAATISGTVKTTGTTTDGLNITTFASGPVGSFNQNGSGVAGANPGNCGGDNCTIGGGDGGDSYSGNVSGGTGGSSGSVAGTAGTRGSGGGGGGTEPGSSLGAAGGAGEVYYRFMRIV